MKLALSTGARISDCVWCVWHNICTHKHTLIATDWYAFNFLYQSAQFGLCDFIYFIHKMCHVQAQCMHALIHTHTHIYKTWILFRRAYRMQLYCCFLSISLPTIYLSIYQLVILLYLITFVIANKHTYIHTLRVHVCTSNTCVFCIVLLSTYHIFYSNHVLCRILHGMPSIDHLRWYHHSPALECRVDDKCYRVAVALVAFHCDVMPASVFAAIIVHVWQLHDLIDQNQMTVI